LRATHQPQKVLVVELDSVVPYPISRVPARVPCWRLHRTIKAG